MKPVARAARIAATGLVITSALLAVAAPASATADAHTASLWSRLWRTPDQRGQALLQQGDAAGAAQAFADPQHKAHAALQAHDYTAAAQTLIGIDTAEAHYNRGNALAHIDDLQSAIRAYDTALKHNPRHTDARHNRDVVAAALQKQKDGKKDESKLDKQQQDKADSKAGNKADGKDGRPDAKPGDKADGEKGGKDGHADSKPGDTADAKQRGKDGKSDAKPGGGNDRNPSDKANDRSGSKSEGKPGQNPADQSNPPPSAKPGERPASPPQPATASASTTSASNAKDDAAQARHDAESIMGKGTQPAVKTQNGPTTPAQGRTGAAGSNKLPLTEKQIAQEQWLRAIPDDPSGLLRRKFLIEHMLRQQGQKL